MSFQKYKGYVKRKYPPSGSEISLLGPFQDFLGTQNDMKFIFFNLQFINWHYRMELLLNCKNPVKIGVLPLNILIAKFQDVDESQGNRNYVFDNLEFLNKRR